MPGLSVDWGFSGELGGPSPRLVVPSAARAVAPSALHSVLKNHDNRHMQVSLHAITLYHTMKLNAKHLHT